MDIVNAVDSMESRLRPLTCQNDGQKEGEVCGIQLGTPTGIQIPSLPPPIFSPSPPFLLFPSSSSSSSTRECARLLGQRNSTPTLVLMSLANNGPTPAGWDVRDVCSQTPSTALPAPGSSD